jgi:uncharacterized protein (TIGR03437 family)
MVWATYLGGSAADSAQSIALDSPGNIWVSGTTASPEFPNANGWSQGSDFVVQLNSSGSALMYSARFPADTVRRSIGVDSHGLVHLAGAGGLVSAISPNQPSMRVFAISNAAGGFPGGRITPGEVISIFGPHLGPHAQVTFMPDTSGLAPKDLAGVQVLINDSAVPLLSVSETRINAIVPSHLAITDFARVRVSFDGRETDEFHAIVSSTAPEIFRNANGDAAALNEDGSVNSFTNPAKISSIVSIWVTGTGTLQPVEGKIATSAQDYHCCAVNVGGQMAEVLYSGASPGIIGEVAQINFRLPNFGEISVVAGSRASSPVPIHSNLSPYAPAPPE